MSEETKLDVEINPPAYPETASPDEQRRAFALECLTSCGDASSIDGRLFVANLQMVAEWLETGKVPAQPRQQRPQPALKTV